MGKSLTDTAKAILMKEGAIPSVSSSQSDPDAGAKSMTPNMGTLRPGSRGAEGRFATPGSMPPGGMEAADDLGGQTPTSGAPTQNMGARAATNKKDSSRSSVSAVPAEKARKQEEIMEEDQIDEEEQLDEVRRYSRTDRLQKELDSVGEKHWDMQDSGRAGSKLIKKGEPKKGIVAAAKRALGLPGGMHADEYGLSDRFKRLDRRWDRTKARLDKVNKRQAGMYPGMNEEHLDEEIEISEELEAFIEAMLEEGYSEEQIAEAIEENFEIVESSHEDDMKHKMMKEAEKAEKEEKEEDEDEEEEDEDKEDKKKMMKEHIDALLAHENLSEDFRERAEVIFESAVSVRLQEEVAVLEEAYAEALEEEVAKIRAELTEQVDDYLNYVVEQWVAENEVAIESGLRSELTEDFISGLRNLFAEHYIDIPEDKVSIVEELGSKVEALETKLNEEIDRNVSLTKMINESKQFEILVSACDGLTTTQAEKLQALAENVTFTSPEEFAAKVQTLKESYFPTTVRADNVLDKVEPSDDSGKLMTEELTGPMAAYVRTLGKTVK